MRRGVEKSRRQLCFAGTDGEVSEPSTCTLCLGHHSRFSTPANWKCEDARTLALSLKVTSDSLVCSACRKDVTRVLADNTYKPRWEKLKESIEKTTCCIAHCTEAVFASLHRASDQLHSTMETIGLKCSASEIPTPTPLCQHHYHLVYKTVQPHQTHCATCGTSLKHSNPRSCPQPTVIEKYLQENTDYDGHISDHDKVCYASYRAHGVILKRGDNVASSDSDLQELIIALSEQVSAEVNSIQEAIDASMKRVIIDVATELIERNALLLPTVHDMLCQYTNELLRANNL